jgi:hypothetical protein
MDSQRQQYDYIKDQIDLEMTTFALKRLLTSTVQHTLMASLLLSFSMYFRLLAHSISSSPYCITVLLFPS